MGNKLDGVMNSIAGLPGCGRGRWEGKVAPRATTSVFSWRG